MANPRVTSMVNANNQPVDGATVGRDMWAWTDANWSKMQALKAQGAVDPQYQSITGQGDDWYYSGPNTELRALMATMPEYYSISQDGDKNPKVRIQPIADDGTAPQWAVDQGLRTGNKGDPILQVYGGYDNGKRNYVALDRNGQYGYAWDYNPNAGPNAIQLVGAVLGGAALAAGGVALAGGAAAPAGAGTAAAGSGAGAAGAGAGGAAATGGIAGGGGGAAAAGGGLVAGPGGLGSGGAFMAGGTAGGTGAAAGGLGAGTLGAGASAAGLGSQMLTGQGGSGGALNTAQQASGLGIVRDAAGNIDWGSTLGNWGSSAASGLGNFLTSPQGIGALIGGIGGAISSGDETATTTTTSNMSQTPVNTIGADRAMSTLDGLRDQGPLTSQQNPYALADNPYLTQMIDADQQQMIRNWNTTQAPTYSQGSSFGNSGLGFLETQDRDNFARTLSENANRYRFQDYNQRAQLAETGAARADQMGQFNKGFGLNLAGGYLQAGNAYGTNQSQTQTQTTTAPGNVWASGLGGAMLGAKLGQTWMQPPQRQGA